MIHYSTEQLFVMLTANPIWYTDYCTANEARVIRSRHSSGKLSLQKYTEIFKHFGYEMNITWVVKD